jgi:HAD superfamily hydrolase (TIGR01484 family)
MLPPHVLPWEACDPARLAGVVGVLSDIDDTLSVEGRIPMGVVAALAALREAGLPTIAVTGRPLGWSREVCGGLPLAATVAENGAVGLYADGSVVFAQPEDERSANALRLAETAARIVREVPGATLARDSAGRVTDIAIDHAEFTHLPPAAIDRVVALMRQAGMEATVSSIHVNGWFGAHSKASGASDAVRRLFGRDLDTERERWVYVGDSTNDEPMFERFRLSGRRRQSSRLRRPARALACVRDDARARSGVRRGGRAAARVSDALSRPMRTRRQVLAAAAALSLGAAVSLGLARFSYALLLPPMRQDLGWTYLVAGAMNTANAAGYLVGALAAPAMLQRLGAAWTFTLGMVFTALVLMAHALAVGDLALAALRLAAGVGSAATFVAGGLLAARLSSGDDGVGASETAGLVLGLYYGGVGAGIVASTAVVPWLAERAVEHAWQGAWVGLGVLALLCAAGSARAARRVEAAAAAGAAQAARAAAMSPSAVRRALRPALVAYFGFGLGYIGYMTFIVSLLREAGLGPASCSPSTPCSASP